MFVYAFKILKCVLFHYYSLESVDIAPTEPLDSLNDEISHISDVSDDISSTAVESIVSGVSNDIEAGKFCGFVNDFSIYLFKSI